MNIGQTYDIANIQFQNGCVNTYKNVSFDSIGRPIIGHLANLNSPYASANPNVFLLQSQCDIKLTDGDGDDIIIRVEAETGYTHIL
jgi:hypothetical protein